MDSSLAVDGVPKTSSGSSDEVEDVNSWSNFSRQRA